MRSWNPFRKKSKDKDEGREEMNEGFAEPTDHDSFLRRGWAFHSKGDQEQAESDFRTALSYIPDSVDANYALGLVFKSQGLNDKAIDSFNKTMKLIEAGKIEDRSKSAMLRRLTLAHINELSKGDWDLEDQIWKQAQ